MYIRKWLNKDQGSAFIEVSFDRDGRGGEIKIADCNRIVSLDFYKALPGRHAYTKGAAAKENKKILAKFDTLLECIQAAKEEFLKDEKA